MGFRRKFLLFGLMVSGVMVGCTDVRHTLVNVATPDYPETEEAQRLTPVFDGLDVERARISVELEAVASGFSRVTDLQQVPGDASRIVVVEQDGIARWLNVETGDLQDLLKVETQTQAEQGLLGFAFHPDWPETPKIYTHCTPRVNGQDVSRIAEWLVDISTGLAGSERVLLEVAQPYGNHNAGQLLFGTDRMLYIGMGDGGWRNDPHGHGQNAGTLLGAVLRIDVEATEDSPYSIPPDNPFLDNPSARDELFAIGLRNPWRLAFSPDQRLVVADVGQNLREEISVVPSGGNLGWKIREADRCFEPEENCPTEGLIDPVYAYGRDDGISVTGGDFWRASGSQLTGQYVFGDFGTGRIWSLRLPGAGEALGAVSALGRFALLPSTFGRTHDGGLLVADYGSGVIYRMAVGSSATVP